MDITGYVEQLQGDLRAAAAAGDEATAAVADRLAAALDAAVRMAILEALSDAAAEITNALEATAVEVRLKGREPQFVVTTTAGPAPAFPPSDPGTPVDDDTPTARITLRLPDGLKVRAEAAAGRARQSLNTWLVEAIRAATEDAPRRRHGAGQHLTGWAR